MTEFIQNYLNITQNLEEEIYIIIEEEQDICH